MKRRKCKIKLVKKPQNTKKKRDERNIENTEK